MQRPVTSLRYSLSAVGRDLWLYIVSGWEEGSNQRVALTASVLNQGQWGIES